MHINLLPIFWIFPEGQVAGDIYSCDSIRANWIIGWIFSKFKWHWLPVQARFPFCFFEDLQYLFCNYLTPLSWQMNPIPIKHHQLIKWRIGTFEPFHLRDIIRDHTHVKQTSSQSSLFWIADHRSMALIFISRHSSKHASEYIRHDSLFLDLFCTPLQVPKFINQFDIWSFKIVNFFWKTFKIVNSFSKPTDPLFWNYMVVLLNTKSFDLVSGNNIISEPKV